MALRTFVKIGKIENLSDARYCAGMMVDILGFNAEEGTDGYVSPEKFSEITEWLAGVKFCGEFTHAHTAEIKLAATQYAFNYIETQDIDQIEELSALDIPLIYKVSINDDSDLENLGAKFEFAKSLVNHITIISANEELHEDIIKSLNPENTEDTSVICGFGISPESTEHILSHGSFSGIELEGSPEERPGYKDYDNVMDVLEVLEELD